MPVNLPENDIQYMLRMPASLRDQIKAIAKTNNRTLKNEILARIKNAVFLSPDLEKKIEEEAQNEGGNNPDGWVPSREYIIGSIVQSHYEAKPLVSLTSLGSSADISNSLDVVAREFKKHADLFDKLHYAGLDDVNLERLVELTTEINKKLGRNPEESEKKLRQAVGFTQRLSDETASRESGNDLDLFGLASREIMAVAVEKNWKKSPKEIQEIIETAVEALMEKREQGVDFQDNVVFMNDFVENIAKVS